MSEPKLGKLIDEGMVKITANMGNGKFVAYNVPRECRYFVANELVNMGAETVQIGNVSATSDEMGELV